MVGVGGHIVGPHCGSLHFVVPGRKENFLFDEMVNRMANQV